MCLCLMAVGYLIYSFPKLNQQGSEVKAPIWMARFWSNVRAVILSIQDVQMRDESEQWPSAAFYFGGKKYMTGSTVCLYRHQKMTNEAGEVLLGMLILPQAQGPGSYGWKWTGMKYCRIATTNPYTPRIWRNLRCLFVYKLYMQLLQRPGWGGLQLIKH